MFYLRTLVPTNWSPDATYQLTDKITLKSAGNRPIPLYSIASGTANFDTVYLISSSPDVMEQTQFLRTWVMFHDFIFDFQRLCQFFEREFLDNRDNPIFVRSIEELHQEPEANVRTIDFDNIAEGIYHPYKPSTQLSYRRLFERYQRFTESEQWLLKSYLFQVETRNTYSITHNLFEDTRKYWQITSYVTLLETILGHAEECEGSGELCSKCNKKLPPHRKMSERDWRAAELFRLIGNEEVKNQYAQVINAAYEIRHRTAHAGKLSSPLYPEMSDAEVYNIARAIQDQKKDMFALDTLLVSVMRVLRYLLLDMFFDLKTFPPLPESQVTTILKWVAPTND